MTDLRDYLAVAVRAWTTRAHDKAQRRRRARPVDAIRHILVVDTETSIDAAQRLLFGVYRYARVDAGVVTTVAEGLIYADELPDRDPDGYRLLREYRATRRADTDLTYLGVEPEWQLGLLSRTEFTERWLRRVGYPHNDRRDPATIVMFNAPFDWSRLAAGAGEARDDLAGGFSLHVWTNPDGTLRGWRPLVAIKALDSKRALKKFRRMERNANDFAGHLLDLRTLVFALTGASHSLASACAAFGVAGKADTPELGVISVEAVDYCREDVAATTRLYQAAMAEYRRAPDRAATHPGVLPGVDRQGVSEGPRHPAPPGAATRLPTRGAGCGDERFPWRAGRDPPPAGPVADPPPRRDQHVPHGGRAARAVATGDRRTGRAGRGHRRDQTAAGQCEVRRLLPARILGAAGRARRRSTPAGMLSRSAPATPVSRAAPGASASTRCMQISRCGSPCPT